MPTRTPVNSALNVHPGELAKDHPRLKKTPQAAVKLDAESNPVAPPKGLEDESADPVGPVGGHQPQGPGTQAALQRRAGPRREH